MRVIVLAIGASWSTAALAHTAEPAIGPYTWAALALLVAIAAGYAIAMRRDPILHPSRVAAFAAGWIVVVLALVGPGDAARFPAHMIQHEVLMLVAPPLIILGRPFAALAVWLSPRLVRLAAWPLRIPPLAAWSLHAVALWTWHAPRLFDAAVASGPLHALQHVCFFATALLFWWTVFRRLRSGLALLYVLTTMMHTGALAALLTFARTPLYGATTLTEQQLGGLIMWVPAGFMLVTAGLVACDRLLASQSR